MRKILLVIAILSLLAIPSLAQDEEEQVLLIDEAPLTSISVDDTEGIQITINGELLDACTELGSIVQFVTGDVITVIVSTTRPADAMCAMVISAFETVYTLDTSIIEAGDYTLNVNDLSEEITIIASADAESLEVTEEPEVIATPEATESPEVTEEPEATVSPEVTEIPELACLNVSDDRTVFDDFGLCFSYPSENDIFVGNDFALISQPLTSNALLLIQVSDADGTSLDDLSEEFGDIADLVIDNIMIDGQASLILESETSREAYIISNQRVYHFVIQPINDTNGEILWIEVINSLSFTE